MVNVQSYVRITDDDSEAWLYLCPPEDADEYSKGEVLSYIKKYGVEAGVNESHIAAMCKKKIYGREVKIASSERGKAGKNGYYEFTFDTGKKKPAIRSDGSVDYRSMSLVDSVKEGTVLAIYHPAQQEKAPRNVRGKFEKPTLYKDLRPLTGKGISNELDPNEYRATKTGKVEYDGDNRLDIVEVYEVTGDCDYTNNPVIEFTGDIVINGNVAAGVEIRAGKSVTVEGVVESAIIEAGTDVCLKRGMQGGGKGSIVAGGDVFTEFIEYATIKAGGDVQSNVILSSNVDCDGKIILTGKKGLIAGGTLHGTRGITCMSAGNVSEIKTMLHAGIRPEMMEQRMAINEEYDKLNKELDDIVSGIAKILRVRQQTGELNQQLAQRLTDLKQRKSEIEGSYEEAKAKAGAVEAEFMAARESSIRIAGNIYHGVIIGIDSHQLIIGRDTSFMEYTCQNGIINGTVVVI